MHPTPEWFVEDLIRTFEKDPNTQMATPVLRLDEGSLRTLDLIAGQGVSGVPLWFLIKTITLYISPKS